MRISIIILLLLSGLTAPAQNQLVLIKKNQKICRFFLGESITYTTEKQDDFITSTLSKIEPTYLILDGFDTVYLRRIKSIDISHKSNNHFKTAASGKKLILAGAVLLGLDLLNTGQSNSQKIDVLFISGALIGVGVLTQFVNNNIFKINNRRKLAVIPLR